MRHRILALARISISCLLILMLLYILRDKYSQIFYKIKEVRIYLLCLGFILSLSALMMGSFRLMLITGAQRIRITFPEAISLTFVGYFFNNFLPTSMGGDVIKAYYLAKKGCGNSAAITSVFMDRMVGMLTMISMAFIALPFTNEAAADNRVRYIIYAIAAGSILFLVFATNKTLANRFSFLFFFTLPVKDKLKKIYNGIHEYKYHKALMARSFLISILSQIFSFLSFGVLLFSVNARISVTEIFIRLPIVNVLSLLPSLNGLGIREGAIVLFFGPLIGREGAFAASVLALLALILISLIGGVIYVLSPQFKINTGESA